MSLNDKSSAPDRDTPPTTRPNAEPTGASNVWFKSNLAAIGSAAVFSVYAAGFVRTRAAAEQFADAPIVRRGGAPHALAAGAAAAPEVSRPLGVDRNGRPIGETHAERIMTPNAAGAATQAADVHSSTPAVAAPSPVDASKSALPSKGAGAAAVSNGVTAAHAETAATLATATQAKTGAANSALPAVTVAPSTQPSAIVAATPTATASVTTPSPAVAPIAPATTPPTTVAPSSTPAPSPPAKPAAAPTPAAEAAAASSASGAPYKDGTYSGWGTSRHGNIQATIEVKDGWIISATISQCLTEYSCSWIVALPPEVTARQNAEIDYVTGATQSSNAFYGAVVQAIAKAK